jgi:hypothetical protein
MDTHPPDGVPRLEDRYARSFPLMDVDPVREGIPHLVPRAILSLEVSPPGLPHILVSHHEPGRPTAPFIPIPWQEHPLVPPLNMFPKGAPRERTIPHEASQRLLFCHQ